ncbi:MAG: DUF58 domain-containing protein [Nanoarchaeota archaeon]|nr:DUF58 domain-containing protein [Nanoarchaeota archaeon]
MGKDIPPSDAPVLDHGSKFLINFPRAISEFEGVIKSFPMKKVIYQSVFQGRGLEFDTYRQYTPQDDSNLLDWMASLRANQLLARKYVEERNLNIYFLVDVSNSMLFGSKNRLKSEYVAEVVVALSHFILGSGDRVGLILFNDGIVKILRPTNSRTQLFLFMKFLADPEFYGGGFELGNAIEYALNNISSDYTSFILVSDFIKVRRDTGRNLKLIGSKFETMAIIVRDPMDEILPDVQYQMSVQDPYSSKQMILDSKIVAEKFKLSAARQKGILKDLFKKSKIDFVELLTKDHFAIPIVVFLKNRALGRKI